MLKRQKYCNKLATNMFLRYNKMALIRKREERMKC